MQHPYYVPQEVITIWIEEILRMKQIDPRGLSLSSINLECLIFSHPKAGEIVMTDSDIFIGTEENQQAVLRTGYDSEHFQDFAEEYSKIMQTGVSKRTVYPASTKTFKIKPTQLKLLQ